MSNPRVSARALALIDEIIAKAELESASPELADNRRVRGYCDTWIARRSRVLRSYLLGEIDDRKIDYELGEPALELADRRAGSRAAAKLHREMFAE